MRSLIYFDDADNEEFENNNVISLQERNLEYYQKKY